MTCNEAIIHLEKINELCKNDCEKKSIEMAIISLKKQIPMKNYFVYFKSTHCHNNYQWEEEHKERYCSNCRSKIDVKNIYCHICGQKILIME